ncbi:MAG: TraU family protein [Syntrophales bacterium]|jgi:conjugal transfer pilus assembly protein TraU
MRLNSKSLIITAFFCIFMTSKAFALCTGTFINPVTDVCWSCLFPIQIGSVSYGNGQEDPVGPTHLPVCACVVNGAVILGIYTAFWEHARLIETVKDPYCFPALGTGMSNSSTGTMGGESRSGDHEDSNFSFQQTHWYIFPVWALLQLFMDLPCLEQAGFDLAYMSEVDPMWSDDSLSFMINPEALLFGNPITQLSCVADSVASTVGFPIDPLFWCFGSWGSPYPLTGSVSENIPINAHPNVAARMVFKMGREGALWDTAIDECSSGVLTPIMVKSHYKFQIARPVMGTQCIPIGRPSLIWGAAKNPPTGNGANSPDNFLWVMTRKRVCCVGYNVAQ